MTLIVPVNNKNENREPRTLQEKLGFLDHDLKTSSHDDMMLWLDHCMDNLLVSLVGGVQVRDTVWAIGCRKQIRDAVTTQGTEMHEQALQNSRYYPQSAEKMYTAEQKILQWLESGKFGWQPWLSPKVLSKVWEQPVTTGHNNYTVGFIDMRVKCEVDIGTTLTLPSSEEWIKGKEPVYKRSVENMEFNFEVKTTIPSLGELVRQVQMYRQFIGGTYVVVSGDTRFKEALAGQKIKFVFYEPHCAVEDQSVVSSKIQKEYVGENLF